MILSVLITMILLLFVSPSIFAANRGRILRNIALWLVLFLALALFYKNFGPHSPHPLFQLPYEMEEMRKEESKAEPVSLPAANNKEDSDTGEKGFTPPKE
jgi:hypothetical protein